MTVAGYNFRSLLKWTLLVFGMMIRVVLSFFYQKTKGNKIVPPFQSGGPSLRELGWVWAGSSTLSNRSAAVFEGVPSQMTQKEIFSASAQETPALTECVQIHEFNLFDALHVHD